MTTPTTVPVRLQLRADTAANWTSVNPILLANELGRETDTGKIKIGNGTSTWTSLAYQAWATLPVAVNAGGTGQTSYTDGELLIGNTTGNTLTKATLTAGSGVAITNGTGSITVAASGIADANIASDAAIVDTKLATITTAGKVNNSATTADSANTASAIVARDASGNFSAGTITADLAGNASTVTTNADLTGDVTSVGNATSIAAGVIVDADVNASAAIAGTKISPDFGSQNVVTTGTSTAASLIPTGSSVPANGVYLPTANVVAIATNTTDRARIDSTGSVLIGPTSNRNVTNNAETPLLLVEGDDSNVRTIACIANPGAEGGFAAKIVLGKSRGTTRGSVTSLVNDDVVGIVQFDGADGTNLVPGASIRAEVEGTPGTNDMPMRMVFATRASGTGSATERMRIDSSGRLLVGTSTSFAGAFSDQALLQTVRADGVAGYTNWRFTNDTGGAIIYLNKSRSTTTGTNTIVQNADNIGTVNFAAADGATYHRAAVISAFVDGTPGANNMPGRLVFSTTPPGSSSPTERMRLDSAGGLSFNAGFGSVAPAFGCRAWIFFAATSGTITVQGSGGVSSVTRNAAGSHIINLSTAMPDVNFCVNVTSGSGFTGHSNISTTTSTDVSTLAVATPHAAGDAGRNLVTIHR